MAYRVVELFYALQGEGADAGRPAVFCRFDFQRRLLQPMHGPEREKHTRPAVEYCLAHPRRRLSLQAHEYLGIR